MKAKFLFYSLLLISSTLFSQTTKSQTIRKQKIHAKSEIDRLADKYKNKHSVILFTSYGDLDGDVEIENNQDGKPQSIKISGQSNDEDAICEFIDQIISQKKRQGYKNTDSNDMKVSENKNYFEHQGLNALYKNGNMYFIARGGYVPLQRAYINPFSNEKNGEDQGGYYWFNIETGDYNRKGGKKAAKLDF